MAKKKKSQNRINRRKNESKKIDSVGSFDADLWGKVFVAIAVIVFLLLFYLLTLYITNKNSEDETKDDTEKTEVTISYDNIPLGRSFSMSDDDYYVIYYDVDDEDTADTYKDLISTYNGKEEHLKIYTVNMGNGVNKKQATTEESNKNPQNASELTINGPTLIKYSGHAVSEYYEGKDSITEQLG